MPFSSKIRSLGKMAKKIPLLIFQIKIEIYFNHFTSNIMILFQKAHLSTDPLFVMLNKA